MPDYGAMVKRAFELAGKVAGGARPIAGLPTKPMMVGGQPFFPGPSGAIRGAAEDYMRGVGRPYVPLQNYVPVDVPRATRIAQEYEVMPHVAADPSVQRSYDALARETREQYEALKKLGIKFEPLPAKCKTLRSNAWLAMKDLLENKHMFYFPSEQGFGSGPDAAALAAQNPMLKRSGVKIGGKEVPFNDLFRIVHDVFGHAKEGVGFRAAGEENAWRSHARMYSPEALPAMTAETRGQNSWVNFGPEAPSQSRGKSARQRSMRRRRSECYRIG